MKLDGLKIQNRNFFNFKHKIHSSLRESNKSSLKTRVDQLEAETAFVLKKYEAENQSKMLQIGDITRSKAMANELENYTHMEHSGVSGVDEMESDVLQKDVKHEWKYKDMDEDNLPAYAEDSKYVLKPGLKEKLSRIFVRSRPKGTGFVECAHTSEERQSYMMAMMKKTNSSRC